MRIVCVGEILWDVVGGDEHLGGAPLNFAVHASQLGHEVYLVSAVGDDERGQRALDALGTRGVSTEFVQTIAGSSTGTAEVELDSDGRPMFRILRPAAYDSFELNAAQAKRIAGLQPRWSYFGTLFNVLPKSLAVTMALLHSAPSAHRFYDVNLRDNNWSLPLVERLSAEANVIKLSDSEAEFLDASLNAEGHVGSVEHFCRRWSKQYGCETVCVTFGERGCAVYREGDYCEAPGYKVEVVDTVGAGDAFAAALLHGLEEEWQMPRIASFANAVGALVASRPGATPEWTVNECRSMIRPETQIRY